MTGRGQHHSQQTNLQNKPDQRKWPVGFCLPLSPWKTWLPEKTEEASEAVPKHLTLLSHIWTLSPTSDMVRLTCSLKNRVETVPDFGRKPLKFQLTLKIRNKRSFSKVLRQCLSLHLNLGQVSDSQQSLNMEEKRGGARTELGLETKWLTVPYSKHESAVSRACPINPCTSWSGQSPAGALQMTR